MLDDELYSSIGMKINFQKFMSFTDISQASTIEVDIRKDFADLMYKNLNGIEAHDLALRIYRSEGDMDVSEGDIALIKALASKATPIFYDSMLANIKE